MRSEHSKDVNRMEQYLQWRKKRSNMLGGQTTSILLDIAVQGLGKGPEREKSEADAKAQKEKERATRRERARRKKALQDDSIPLQDRLKQLQIDLKHDLEMQRLRQTSQLYKEFELGSSESAPVKSVSLPICADNINTLSTSSTSSEAEHRVLAKDLVRELGGSERLVGRVSTAMSNKRKSKAERKKSQAKDRDRQALRQEAQELIRSR
jgi:hypothetical protein